MIRCAKTSIVDYLLNIMRFGLHSSQVQSKQVKIILSEEFEVEEIQRKYSNKFFNSSYQTLQHRI